MSLDTINAPRDSDPGYSFNKLPDRGRIELVEAIGCRGITIMEAEQLVDAVFGGQFTTGVTPIEQFREPEPAAAGSQYLQGAAVVRNSVERPHATAGPESIAASPAADGDGEFLAGEIPYAPYTGASLRDELKIRRAAQLAAKIGSTQPEVGSYTQQETATTAGVIGMAGPGDSNLTYLRTIEQQAMADDARAIIDSMDGKAA